jgi:CPA2 family monovalent cation:H+ antiporter-2
VPALATWAAGPGGGVGDAPASAAMLGHGGTTGGALELVLRGLGTIGLVVLAFFAARRLVPWLIARAATGRSRETFLAAVLFVVAGSAWLSQQAGLSVALGAFLSGLVLAESQHRSQIHADILPFRDLMLSVFFISIGMLLTPWTLLLYPTEIAFATVGMVLWKLIAAACVARYAGYPWRVAFAAGLGLAHIGEFSFVLAQAGAPACARCSRRGS